MAKTTAMAVRSQLQPEVDPRVRMKEVRAEVRMFVEGKAGNPWGINHIGELYADNSDDQARAMIALHDMLDVRAQKHNKASNHVAELLQDLDAQNQTIFDLQNQISSDTSIINFLDNAGQELRVRYEEQVKQTQKLKEDLMIQGKKLEAALLTIHTVMEG